MNQRISGFALFLATMLLFSYIEAILPLSIGIPGAKLGLANIIIVIALYRCMHCTDVFLLSISRSLIVGITFGNLSALLFSLAGALLSVFIMTLALRSKLFGIIGISILGAVFHNLAQLIVALLVMRTIPLLFYIPFLLFSGTCTGILIGILANECLKRFKPFNNNN